MLSDISFLSTKEEIFKYIKETSKNGKNLELHPLGFYRINVLSEDRLSEGYYIHIWLNETNGIREEDLIHNHIFDMESKVICGKVLDEVFSVSREKTGNTRMCVVVYEDNKSIRKLQKESYLTCKLRETLVEENDIYQVGKGIFHKTKILSFPTITLMRKTNLSSEQNPVALISNSEEADFEYKYSHREENQVKALKEIVSVLEV